MRKGVASPRPAKPLPRSSRGAEGAPVGGPAAGPRGASPSDFGPRGVSLGGNGLGSGFGLMLSPLGGYPPKLDGLRSR